MLSRHTSLLEIAIISLYNRMINRLNLDAERFRLSGAVLAVGAFGRGLLGPNQAVPVLFLRAESSPWKEEWIDEIATPLIEAGWTVDVQQGTIDLVLEQAGRDSGRFFELLETRYVSGNRQVAERLEKTLEAFIEEHQDDLLSALFEPVQVRRACLEDPKIWLEPNLDRAPGGLSEITAIRAACRVVSNVRNLEDAIYGGYLTRQEVDLLQQAEKTYTRLLNLVRNLDGGSISTLGFKEQEILADKLGYQARSGFLPVEAFLQHIEQLLHGVQSVSQEFWERLGESREGDGEEEEAPSQALEAGVVTRGGRIHLQTDRYPPKASKIIHLFALAARTGMGLANVTRQWIRHHRNALDTAAGDQTVREELLALIRTDAADLPTIRC